MTIIIRDTQAERRRVSLPCRDTKRKQTRAKNQK
jgi:hypothetical protein